MNSKLQKFIKEFQTSEYVFKYSSWKGETCYRSYAPFAWFLLKIRQVGFKRDSFRLGSLADSTGTYFLEYTEGDVTLSKEGGFPNR